MKVLNKVNQDKFKLIITLSTLFVLIFGLLVTNFQNNKVDAQEYTAFENTLLGETSVELNSVVNNCDYIGVSGLLPGAVTAVERAIFGAPAETRLAEANTQLGRSAEDCLTNPEVRQVASLNIINEGGSGALGDVMAVTSILFEDKPISGTEYFDQQIYALRNPFDASAQSPDSFYYPGTGFSSLRPIQSFWGWSVNITYGIMIFFILAVAFAVMFRARLSGGANITIQTAIPNIALAMILIPLSYGISGLFIDAVTIGTNISREFLIGSGSPGRVVYEYRNCSQNEQARILNGSLNIDPENCIGNTVRLGETDRGLFADDPRVSWWRSSQQVDITSQAGQVIQSADEGIFGGNGFLNNAVFNFISGIFLILSPEDENAANPGLGNTSILLGKLVNFIIGIVLLITSIRIFWLLLVKYVFYFTLLPIFSPFIMASAAIPGNGTKQVVTYLKLLGSASLFYIVAYTMILLTFIFSSLAFAQLLPIGSQGTYVPPLLGLEGLGLDVTDPTSPRGQAIGEGVNTFIFALSAIAIYLNIPPQLRKIDSQLGTEFKVPEFFTNAFQSAKDSVNLGRQGLKYGQQAANFAGRSSIGRNLFGADGLVTRNYRDLTNAARTRINTAKESNNILTRISARTLGNVATAAFNASDAAIAAATGGDASNARTTGGFGGAGTLAATPRFNGADLGGGIFNMTNAQIFGVLDSFRAGAGVPPPPVRLAIPVADGVVLPPQNLGNFTSVRMRGFGLRLAASDGLKLPSSLRPGNMVLALTQGNGADFLSENFRTSDSSLQRRRIRAGAGELLDRINFDLLDGDGAFGHTAWVPNNVALNASDAYVRFVVEGNNEIFTNGDRTQGNIGLALEFGLRNTAGGPLDILTGAVPPPAGFTQNFTPLFGDFDPVANRFISVNNTLIGVGRGSLRGLEKAIKINGVSSGGFRFGVQHVDG